MYNLDTILKIRNCAMMTRWHHSDSSKARSAEHESVKKKTLDLSSRSKWFSAGLICIFFLFMPPTLKKWGHIGFGLSVCTCMCVCMEVQDIVLKLHAWIPHGKIADTYLWFSLNYLPL